MGWTAPRTYTAGEIITASILNTHLRDQLLYLKGVGQVPTIESGLVIDNTDGDEYVKLPLLSTAETGTVLDAEGKVAFDEQTHQLKLHNGTAVKAVISEADVDDTPVNGANTVPVSSNWAYDHVAAADPHTGYVLESLADAQADTFYATADNTWARLAKGTAYQLYRMNAGATAPEWASATVPVAVVKTGDETVNNSDTLQNDNELTLSVGANTVWFIVLYLKCHSGTVPGIKFAFTVPSGGAIYYAHSIFASGATPDNGTEIDITSSTSLTTSGNATDVHVLFHRYVGGANAGNVQLQWAQSTAETSDTKVLTGSFILGIQIV